MAACETNTPSDCFGLMSVGAGGPWAGSDHVISGPWEARITGGRGREVGIGMQKNGFIKNRPILLDCKP